jgi:hypothetical protein
MAYLNNIKVWDSITIYNNTKNLPSIQKFI